MPAGIHILYLRVEYFIMLLELHYNRYINIYNMISALLGSYVFDREGADKGSK